MINSKHKITIPKPCDENWDKMTPNENGRFCSSCSKTVIDFTAMIPEEIQHFFIQNQNNKICGRFKKSQLSSITIQIPIQVLHIQMQYPKMFLLALFIAMGTTLFSCADNEGNKLKIDTVEIVDDTPKEVIEKQNNEDSLFKKPPPKSIAADPVFIEYDPPSVSGPSHVDSYISGDVVRDYPICYLDALPEYPGGYEKFSEFIKNEFKIPKKAKRITGEIETSFVIEKNGVLSQIKVFDNIGHETGEEIIRVLKGSKKWKPGFIDGKFSSVVLRFNIIIQKDSLNPERRKRNLSKIVSINRVNEKDQSISQVN